MSRKDMKPLIVMLIKRVEERDQRLAALEARLNEPPKNSGTSSEPPSKGFKANKQSLGGSSDKAGRTGLRQGSVGRKGDHRPLADDPDETVRVMAKRCGCCGHGLGEADQKLSRAYDKIDLPKVGPHVTRVEIYEGVCPCCAGATVPEAVPDGLCEGSPFSLNIAALATYLRFIRNVGYERSARLCRDLFGLDVGEGALNNMLRRAKPRFDQEVDAIPARLRKSRVVCSDETSVRIDGVNRRHGVLQNDDIVLHVIRRSRGHSVVEEVLGGHRPALWVSNLYGAQQGHAEEWPICLAHQWRDGQYACDAVFAPRLTRLLLRAFVIAKRRKTLAEATRRSYKARLERNMDAIRALPVEHKDARRLRKHYGKHRGSLFTLLEHPEIAPDNNGSERALRPTATYRKVTGGFRSAWGADLYAAVRSTVGTAAKHAQNAFISIQTTLGISQTYSPG